MIKTKILSLALLTVFALSCKKETKPKTTEPTTKPPSQQSLLCNTWILSETYEDDVQKTSGGTGQYRFTTDGQFQFFSSNKWGSIGTYQWNDSDSNSVSVLFTGASMSYWWYIKKLDTKAFNTEFMVGGKKLNYNYTR